MTIKAKDATSNASVPKLATESGSAEASQADNVLRAKAQRQESNAAHESSSDSDESDKVADDKPADAAEQIAAPAGVMIEKGHNAPASKRATRKNICKFYLGLHGCLKDNCDKKHDETERAASAHRRANTPCRFFLADNCMQGDACAFKHTVTDNDDTKLSVPKLTGGTEAERRRNAVNQTGPNTDDSKPRSNISQWKERGPTIGSVAPGRSSDLNKLSPMPDDSRSLAPNVRIESTTKRMKLELSGRTSTTQYRVENLLASSDRQREGKSRCHDAVRFTLDAGNSELSQSFIMVCPNSHTMIERTTDCDKKCSGRNSKIRRSRAYYFCECGYIYGHWCSLDSYRPVGETSFFGGY